MKEFEDKSHLLIEKSLNDKDDDIIRARNWNPTLEHR